MMHNGFGHYGNWMNGPGLFFHGPLGFIIGLLFWGLILYLAVKLFGALFSRENKNNATPLALLKERYATGKISEDEYHRMKTEFV